MKRLPLCSSSSSFFFPPPLFSQPPFADRLLHNGTPQKCGSRRGGRRRRRRRRRRLRRLCEKVRGNETTKRLERVQKKSRESVSRAVFSSSVQKNPLSLPPFYIAESKVFGLLSLYPSLLLLLLLLFPPCPKLARRP